MDQVAQGRRRPPNAQTTTKPHSRVLRDKRTQKEAAPRAVTGRIREAKDSSEIIRVPKRIEATGTTERSSAERPSSDEDANARRFAVANVGPNGVVYLKPSRLQAALPQSPPGTADGPREMLPGMEARRPSAMSGTWTPRVPAPRGNAMNTTMPMPPLSMANVYDRRRTRSHSFSTMGDSVRSPTFDSTDFQILLNGRDTERPKSSVDLSDPILDLRIPHYRLGTPRFSERGTAYLHNSTYTSTSDLRSSVFSRADYDKLFPAPPGRDHAIPGGDVSPLYLHPSQASYSVTPSRTPPTPQASPTGGDINPSVFDKVEARINDATLVRYSPSTGRIIAATPARLIAQITSPFFLDYDLLADFFLTFRGFLSCSDLLEYMLARMRWALSNNSDAGRIVRVRTFVAMRHWILNYFADDFIPNMGLRQRFCKLVNELTRELLRRPDQGGTDMNVIGELKKCWRRTCAKFWPDPLAMDAPAQADVLPGLEQVSTAGHASSVSLPLPARQRHSQMDFRRSSIIRLPPDVDKSNGRLSTPPNATATPASHGRTTSIPTSPMSEDSLTILSCSVPFLKHMMPGRDRPTRPPGPQRNPAHGDSGRPRDTHKRSGSFTDALRDGRPPLPSTQPESIALRSLPSNTFTGGLVRGLLLQPSPSKVELLVPLSPPIENQTYLSPGTPDNYFQEQQYQSVGMRRLVGDVRRALSKGKGRHESPSSSHRSTNSSDSRNSGQLHGVERTSGSHGGGTWHQLGGPPRIDMLAEQIETSYQEVFQSADARPDDHIQVQAGPVSDDAAEAHVHDELSDTLPGRSMRRLDSHVTTGSRSIVIMDDTGVPAMPPNLGRALPSVSSWSSGMAPTPLFRQAEAAAMEALHLSHTQSDTVVASEPQRSPTADSRMHHLLVVPEAWNIEESAEKTEYRSARKSSNVHPSDYELQPIRNQLRRRPGGDLKAADHVHDLEPTPRHQHGDSYSTITRSMISDAPTNELSGTHFSGQGYQGWDVTNSFAGWTVTEPMQLLPTGSSQAVRPSFQHEVSHLKQLDEPGDGGREDALAKLEGKPSSATLNSSAQYHEPSLLPARQGPRSSSVQYARVLAPGQTVDSAEGSALWSPTTARQGASIYRMSGDSDIVEQHEGPRPVLKPTNPDTPTTRTADSCAIESVDFADMPRALTETPQRRGASDGRETAGSVKSPINGTPQGSFLLDDNESLSDISTELAESIDDSLGVRSFFFDDTPADENPLTNFIGPPTPPPTVGPSVSSISEPSLVARTAQPNEKKTLKGAASAPKLLASNLKDPQFEQRPDELRRVRTSPSNRQFAHLPFVLAFESDVIAEQMTIVEKDALDEVEWKDLVGLNWVQNPCPIRNWVEFLKQESNGIDIVIARFNLVVKWVVSECLLTEAPSERARCITKYIHIAAHCHRLRNYASMYQITLALLSTDLTRLHQTWALVSPSEKAILDRLEKLCQPLRNFHNLRSEMESAAEGEACIPFIGLYTHDLMFNAQKPALIDPLPPGREKLVNFERYQTSATIVKSLLRLIEASSKYIFRPHPEVLSRCLWLAALEDGEITKRSKELALEK